MIEVTGEHRREKAAKVATAETYWIPAVSGPWDAANLIRDPGDLIRALS